MHMQQPPPHHSHQHQQQQQQQQLPHSHHKHEEAGGPSVLHCHSNAAYGQQPQRKHSHSHSHSHSPHHSRHTSPHSHHSHSSQHSQSCSAAAAAAAVVGSSAAHQHHHHYRRRRRQHSAGGSGSLPGAHSHRGSCSKRHRSVTDVSSNSINACQDVACADREVQDIMVRKPCSSSSRTELAQYFAEDLYGASRRPSSCCTSSDYCYQTDSTSLYGSRSSLSRNNSIKSASAAMRKQQRLQQRQPSYTSISLRGLNASRPNSQLGSLTSIFDRAKQLAAAHKPADEAEQLTPSHGSTLERHSSKGALSNELPEYACSPSPIRWSFLADGRSPTELEGAAGGSTTSVAAVEPSDEKVDAWHVTEPQKKSCRKQPREPPQENWKSVYDEEGPSTSAAAAAAAARKRRGSSFHCEFEESTTVLFHQEGEAYNNCCNNYIQCNTYLDQDLQITSEDIHQYLSKGNHAAGDVLNNSKNYPFQPSNALEFQYKNNFAANSGSGSGIGSGGNNNTPNTNTSNTASSDAGEYFQRYERSCRRNSSKETNLNQNAAAGSEAVAADPVPLSPTNINLSTSSNNINIVFNSSLERSANEVKFINNRDERDAVVSAEAHHAGYLPYTYPSYDYTNMSANSQFDKPMAIDELPKEFVGGGGGGGGGSTNSEHSSSLPSPTPMPHVDSCVGISFESFDAASEHNLLSQRSSCCQYSSPMSPDSPTSPTPMASSVNPAGDGYMHLHHTHYDYELQEHSQHSNVTGNAHSHYHRHAHTHTHQHHTHSHAHQHHSYIDEPPHAEQLQQQLGDEQFRLGNAFKKVRKRARKYTDFLRKK